MNSVSGGRAETLCLDIRQRDNVAPFSLGEFVRCTFCKVHWTRPRRGDSASYCFLKSEWYTKTIAYP